MLADLSSLRRRQSKSPKNIEFSLGSRIINVIDIEFLLEVFKIHYTYIDIYLLEKAQKPRIWSWQLLSTGIFRMPAIVCEGVLFSEFFIIIIINVIGSLQTTKPVLSRVIKTSVHSVCPRNLF